MQALVLLLIAGAASAARPTYHQATDSEGKTMAISALGTARVRAVVSANMAPRGSAVLTQSGALAEKGITRIIHAAPGSMGNTGRNFRPTRTGLRLSLRNSFALADRHGLKCLAVPFLGGGIFLGALRMDKNHLAAFLLDQSVRLRPSQQVVFVTWGEEDTAAFQAAFARRGHTPPANFRFVPGSLTDFAAHGCDTIVNAANMEVQFGGGLSGVVGDATGKASLIDQGAQELIRGFYRL